MCQRFQTTNNYVQSMREVDETEVLTAPTMTQQSQEVTNDGIDFKESISPRGSIRASIVNRPIEEGALPETYLQQQTNIRHDRIQRAACSLPNEEIFLLYFLLSVIISILIVIYAISKLIVKPIVGAIEKTRRLEGGRKHAIASVDIRNGAMRNGDISYRLIPNQTTEFTTPYWRQQQPFGGPIRDPDDTLLDAIAVPIVPVTSLPSEEVHAQVVYADTTAVFPPR